MLGMDSVILGDIFAHPKIGSYHPIMATNSIERGPTSDRVSENIREIREARGLSLRDLYLRLDDIGRPILPSGLHKIENGERRVDVDDLVAIAIALDVTPTRLLLTAGSREHRAHLTSVVKDTERALWTWALGEETLPDPWQAPSPVPYFDFDRLHRFQAENRPQDPPSGMAHPRDFAAHAKVLGPVVKAHIAAKAAGLTERDIQSYLEMLETMRQIDAAMEPRKAAARAKKGSR